MKKISVLLSIILIILSFTACQVQQDTQTDQTQNSIESSDINITNTDVMQWPEYTEYSYSTDVPVKNIILMIGDGMGENTIKNAEIVKGSKLLMQGLKYTTHVTTDSLDGTTDSAAAATAISCGIKTHNQYIGVDGDTNDVESICEFAKSRGLKTGLVATQIINHATPASMICHCDYRQLYNVLLKQEIKADIDVLLGGGSEYFSKSVEKLSNEHNYNYITKGEELSNLTNDNSKKTLGLFSYNAMYAGVTPSLATMTNKALDLLSNDNGFFLMVEGSNIDVKLAKVDMDGAMKEMTCFDQAIDVVLKYASENPGTLVIITADHETGGVILPESNKPEDVNNELITSNGEHTGTNVLLMAAGAHADTITQSETIDNTDISKFMREFLNETYGEKEVNLLNHNIDVSSGDEPLN